MTWNWFTPSNDRLWSYNNKYFNTPGNHPYNITCIKGGYQTTVASSSIWVTYNTSLRIWNDSRIKYENQDVLFSANYTQDETNTVIPGGNCTILFSDGPTWYNMSFNQITQLYEYTKQFSKFGTYTHNYTVNCTKQGWETQLKQDNVSILALSSEYIYIQPDAAYTNTTLTCINTTFTDPGTAYFTLLYEWYKNDSIVKIEDLASNGNVKSQQASAPGHLPVDSIDNNPLTYWESVGFLPSADVTFNLTKSRKIGKLSYRFEGSADPQDFSVYYSTDNNFYQNLYSNLNAQRGTTIGKIFSPVNAQYIKFIFPRGTIGPSLGLGGLAEFNIYPTNTLYEEYFNKSDLIYCKIIVEESGFNTTSFDSRTNYREHLNGNDWQTGTFEQTIIYNFENLTLQSPYTSGNFTSAAIDFYKKVPLVKNITWASKIPSGTNITMQTRMSSDNISWSEWQGRELEANSDTIILIHFNGNSLTHNGFERTGGSGFSYSEGKWNEGLLLNQSSSNYISYASNSIEVDEGTISFWVSPKWLGTDSSLNYFFDKGTLANQNRISITKGHNQLNIPNNQLAFVIYDIGTNPYRITYDISNWTQNEWYMVTVTYNLTSTIDFSKNNISVYINGELKNSTKGVGYVFPVAADILIGNSFGGGFVANATIDEFITFSKALSENEISSIYQTAHINNSVIAGPHLRYLQYRAFFATNNELIKPVLENVRIKQYNYSVHIRNSPPTNVSLIYPEKDSVIETGTPNLNWTDSTDLDKDIIYYEVLIANDSSFINITANLNYANNIKESNYTLNTSQNLSDNYYWWKVRADDTDPENNAGDIRYSDWSRTNNFLVDREYPEIFNETRMPETVYSTGNVTLYANVTDVTINTVLVEGNWTHALENFTVTNYIGTPTNRRYSYTIPYTYLTGGDFVVWRFYANDSASHTSYTQQRNFTVLQWAT